MATGATLRKSGAALTDAGAAAAYRGRMEAMRGALRGALTRAKTNGHLSAAWKLEEAVDMLAALLSVDTYQQLVVEGGWKPDALMRRIWELSQVSFLVRTKKSDLFRAGSVSAGGATCSKSPLPR